MIANVDQHQEGTMHTNSAKQTLRVVALTAATIAAWLVPGTAAEAQTVDKAVQRYAPVVFLHSDDNDDPMSAARYINGSRLRWSHAGCDDHQLADEGGIDAARLRPRRAPAYSHLAGCDHDLGKYYAGQFTRPRDSGNPFDGDAEGFFIDLNNDHRTGTGTSAPVYFEFRRNPRSITYWFLYGFNQGPAPTGADNHEGDWERVSIQLNSDNRAVAVAYNQHNGACRLAWPDAPKTRSRRPVAFSANGSHASYPWAGSYPLRPGGVVDDDADRGPRWRTVNNLQNVRQQPWYGYGGAWGEVGNSGTTTGPSGPSPYKLGPPSDFNDLDACERPS
jgi:hypothetical protein